MAPGNRGQRGAPNRSRGSRGQASTSRGALSSSVQPATAKTPDTFEKSRQENEAKRLQKNIAGIANGRGGGNARGQFHNKTVRFDDQETDLSSTTLAPGPNNTAVTKPALRSTSHVTFSAMKDAPSGPQDVLATKFGIGSTTPMDAQTRNTNGFAGLSSVSGRQASQNGFGGFGNHSQMSHPMTGSPFGAQPQPMPISSSPFSSGSTGANPFGAFSQPPSASPNPFSAPRSAISPFGASPGSASNPFSVGATGSNPFGAPSQPVEKTSRPEALFSATPLFLTTSISPSILPGSATASPPAFGFNFNAPQTGKLTSGVAASLGSTNAFAVTSGRPAADAMVTRAARFGFQADTTSKSTEGKNKNGIKANGSPAQGTKVTSTFQQAGPVKLIDSSSRSSESLARKINEVLRKDRIVPPIWPGWDTNDSKPVAQHERIKKYWNDFREYQSKVRASLIRANLIDDPEVPKKLSEAIDFKGTCEEMCPEWEKVDRIISSRVDDAEKEINPDGTVSRYPSPPKMIKALARSAAGQEAPLPDEVRSAAALRKTVDYLFGTVLANSDLPTVYTFLWDRTRAVRRDFVFHSFMSKLELEDQVNCLEKIVRFHVIAAHQMSQDGVNTHGFSEQQELEQLGKSLLSLIHAYEDCSAQGILCKNETEFRAYHIMWGARSNPGILEEVQNWGWKYWGKDEDIQLAVSLVEALQTPWDTLPLKPRAETDIAQNAFARFFSIIEEKRVSYTMACFAETFFNHVRFSILRTILRSYRKQRDQAKDWTISKLNEYFRFDHEDEVVPFCEKHGLHFDEANDVEYLSFDHGEEVTQPSPPLKQGYSYNIVERKRGESSLPEAIFQTVYEEPNSTSDVIQEEEEEESLFVRDDLNNQITATQSTHFLPPCDSANGSEFTTFQQPILKEGDATDIETAHQPTSIFDRIPVQKNFDSIFKFPSPKSKDANKHTTAPGQSASVLFQAQSQNESSSAFFKKQEKSVPQTPNHLTPTNEPPKPFSFIRPTAPQPNVEQPAVPIATIESPRFSFASPQPTTSAEVQPNVGEPVPKPAIDVQSMSNKFPPPAEVFSPESVPPSDVTSSVPRSEPTSSGTSEGPLEYLKTDSHVVSASAKIAAVAKWVALGSDGLMEHFIANQVELILRDTAKLYLDQEAIRKAREAEQLAQIEAENFRLQTLATKFGRLWREKTRILRLRRRGRATRQARRELAENMRASKAAQSANLVEDFKASTSRRRDSLASLLDAPIALNGVHELRRTLSGHERSRKRHRSGNSVSSNSSSAVHKRGQSEHQGHFRRSLLSDPSYLQGGSRIHLMPDYHSSIESSPRLNGVTTDYFRLKARGISTLSDGNPLANSAASNTSRRKRSIDRSAKLGTSPQTQASPPTPSAQVGFPSDFATSEDDIQTLKIKAQAMVAKDQMLHQKRVYIDEEEELFERAKRVREQMDEGASWYRKETEMGIESRSVS